MVWNLRSSHREVAPTKVEPLQQSEELRELKLDKAKPKTHNQMVLPLDTTEARGALYHRYPAHPARHTKVRPPSWTRQRLRTS